MSPASEDEVFSAAIAGLPKIIAIIATVPPEGRQRALAAAEQSYLQTARTLGYDEHDAHSWASSVMARLQTKCEINNFSDECTENGTSLVPWPFLETEETEKVET